MSIFDGLDIVVSSRIDEPEYRREQVRFPRSKKKRIRKKWAKNPKNYKTTVIQKGPTFYRIGDRIITSIKGYQWLRA